MSYFSDFQSIDVYSHHIKQSICGTRAKYREGRKDTAVKVYTINQESLYLLVSNVPAVGGSDELRAVCDQYGNVIDFRPLDEYPTEEFTEVYLVKYDIIASARIAKKQLDDKSFLGGCLHVCYAPEFESVMETRLKLQDRRKFVAWKTNSGKKSNSSWGQSTQTSLERESQNNSSSRLPVQPEPVTYVWAGKEYTVMPPSSSETETQIRTDSKSKTTGIFVPRQCMSGGDSSFTKTISNVNFGQSTSSQSSSSTNEDSYSNTMSQVRAKVARVSVPNMRVSFKRKKRL